MNETQTIELETLARAAVVRVLGEAEAGIDDDDLRDAVEAIGAEVDEIDFEAVVSGLCFDESLIENDAEGVWHLVEVSP
jgi:ribosomal protein L12E/L44/L45/RPP1/RPP2